GAGLLRYLVHAGIAVLLILLLSVPFLLLFPLLKLRGKWITKRKTCFGESHQSTISLAFPSISGNGVLCTLAEALSLDRFPLLFKVLEGRIAVIGSNPQETGGNTGRYPSLAAGYRPALYSYAEAEDWPVNSEEGAIVERYFASHGGLFQDLVLVVKAFLNRMHSKDRQ
ncbi:MAG: NDP-sugar synthase, partial [Chlorobiaceae bacterium]|nr:NDP-sugar synthase [Chlorobiaceae bacterium]